MKAFRVNVSVSEMIDNGFINVITLTVTTDKSKIMEKIYFLTKIVNHTIKEIEREKK